MNQSVILNKLTDRRFLVAILVVATVLRIFYLSHHSIWVDEMNTINKATPSHGFTIWEITRDNVHGPLPTFMLFLWKFVSNSDWWLRFFSALAGIAGVATCFLWIRMWLGNSIGRLTALLLAINPLHIHYSQEVRNYAFVFLFATLAGYLLELWLAKRDRATGWRYALAVAAAALSNFSTAFFFAAQTIVYFGRERVRKASIGRWIIVCAIVAVLISPWVYTIFTWLDVGRLVTPVVPGGIATSERLRGETTVSLSSLPYTFYVYSVGFTLGPSMRELHLNADMRRVLQEHTLPVAAVAVVFGSLFLLGIVGAVRKRLRWWELLAHLLVPLLGTIALNWQNAKAFNVRYVLLALPAFLAFVAIALQYLPSRLRAVALGAIILLCALSLKNFYFNGDYAKADVRAAVAHVDEHIGPDECIFAPTVWLICERYHQGPQPIQTVFRVDLTPEQVDAMLAGVFAGCNSLWYLRARPWVLDRDNYVYDSVMAAYDVVQRIEFDGVTLFHVIKKNL